MNTEHVEVLALSIGDVMLQPYSDQGYVEVVAIEEFGATYLGEPVPHKRLTVRPIRTEQVTLAGDTRVLRVSGA